VCFCKGHQSFLITIRNACSCSVKLSFCSFSTCRHSVCGIVPSVRMCCMRSLRGGGSRLTEALLNHNRLAHALTQYELGKERKEQIKDQSCSPTRSLTFRIQPYLRKPHGSGSVSASASRRLQHNRVPQHHTANAHTPETSATLYPVRLGLVVVLYRPHVVGLISRFGRIQFNLIL